MTAIPGNGGSRSPWSGYGGYCRPGREGTFRSDLFYRLNVFPIAFSA